MTKLKKLFACVLCAAILSLSAILLFTGSVFANAETQADEIVDEEVGGEIKIGGETAETNGYVMLSLSLDGGDGYVWATVKNELTVFPQTVVVIVELYASTNYYESYTDMEMVAYNQISDLNIGKTLTAKASTNGEQKYWHGRLRCKINSGDWGSKSTGTGLFDANGDFVSYI